MDSSDWTSLEVAKLVVGALVPIFLLVGGVWINRSLKRLEHIQWGSQRLIEKRIELYDEIAPLLNQLYCFFVWVGEWKQVTPPQALALKRTLDKQVHIYRHILGEDFFDAYQVFIDLQFQTFNGPGEDARLRTVIRGPDGDRAASVGWQSEWTVLFTTPAEVSSKQSIRGAYLAVMRAFTDSIGIEGRQTH